MMGRTRPGKYKYTLIHFSTQLYREIFALGTYVLPIIFHVHHISVISLRYTAPWEADVQLMCKITLFRK